MERKPAIAFNGDLTVDMYMNQGKTHLGGSSLTSAIWTTREGASASVLAAIGLDAAGDEFMKKMQEHKINTSHIQRLAGKTSTLEINTQADGERVYGAWHPGVLPEYTYSAGDIDFLNGHDAIVVSVYDKTVHILDQLFGAYKNQTDKKPLRVVDFGDLGQFGKSLDIVTQYSSGFDMFLFGLDQNVDNGLIKNIQQFSRTTGKLSIVTLEQYGSIAFQGMDTYSYTGRQLKAVDATGAGDSFLAGFLCSYLTTNRVESALEAGASLAEQVILQVGAY